MNNPNPFFNPFLGFQNNEKYDILNDRVSRLEKDLKRLEKQINQLEGKGENIKTEEPTDMYMI